MTRIRITISKAQMRQIKREQRLAREAKAMQRGFWAQLEGLPNEPPEDEALPKFWRRGWRDGKAIEGQPQMYANRFRKEPANANL
ncbi:MAG: hypothetical protein ACFFD1_01025 [Candidatus Thorarchaeota archaeon]